MISLSQRLATWAADRSDATAFTFLRRGEEAQASLSFGELDRRARRIAGQLTSSGLAGCPVALIYPAGLEFIEAFCGCLYAGAIPAALPLPANARAAVRCAVICRTADFGAVLTIGSQLASPALQPIRDAAPEVPWICTDGAPDGPGQDPVEVVEASPAFLQFTSGSTSEPRGVVITHANLTANQQMIAQAFDQDSNTRSVSWLPLHHDMGLVGAVLQPIYLGIPSTIMSAQSFLQKPVRWLQAISRRRATSSGSPNFGYAMCVDRIPAADLPSFDLSSWRVAFCGAEPVRPATLEGFAARFAPSGFDASALFPCYGMAEATLFVSGGPAGAGLRTVEAPDGRTVASCGRGWGQQTITIVDPELRTASAAGEPGEIWLTGPHVAEGYRNGMEATARTFRAKLAGSDLEHLRTGDIGFLRDGELFVTGRLKDLLIVRGANIHPEDVEDTVRRSDPLLAGAGCAAFVLGEEDEKIAVVVELARASGGGDRSALWKAASAAILLEHGFAPQAVLFVGTGGIPRTTSGKVRRRACREAYMQGQMTQLAVREGA